MAHILLLGHFEDLMQSDVCLSALECLGRRVEIRHLPLVLRHTSRQAPE